MKKFGAPLYASAWADTRTVLVAGGGKKSSGIPNRWEEHAYTAAPYAPRLC